MKRILSFLFILILCFSALTACGNSEPAEETASPKEPVTEAAQSSTVVSDEMREIIRPVIDECFTDHGFKGAAYLVYRGEEVYSGGAGKADKKADIDNSADVVYHIASVTKQFTAAAILMLCGQGKMSLDDTLSMYYPDYTVGHPRLCAFPRR